MNQFTNEDLNNIKALILKAPITGNESVTVAILLQKIQTLMISTKEEIKPEATTHPKTKEKPTPKK